MKADRNLGDSGSRAMLDVAIVVVVCVGPYLIARLISDGGRGDGMVWLVWAFGQAAAAFGWGMWKPSLAMVGAVLIVVTQPMLVFAGAWLSGEVAQPSRSTGGMAGVCIVSAFSLMLSPVPLAAAWIGRREGTRGSRSAPPGR